ncbi:ATP-binding protein [Streptomyces cinerochromogenes]|uniref:ATP-binding protein n=1 Tax=Streptomyces cinerochromogenes TaxID=66422 RepID=UPI00369A86E5
MDAAKTKHLSGELDAYAHWFVEPDPAAGGHLLAVTLFAEFGDTAWLAREVTATFLRGAGAGELVDDAQLVVSELVANVVNHTFPDRHLARPGGYRRIDVTFKKYPKWVFMGVSDEDSTPPLLPVGETFPAALAGELSEAVLPNNGRGLLISQRLATSVWWSPEERGGKTVWCRFDLDQPGAYSA